MATGEPTARDAARQRNLRRLFDASAIACIGGRGLVRAIEHCRRGAYAGRIHVVNPREREIAGIACAASVDDLPEPPDAAFVGVPREATIDVVAALARRGAGTAVCYAAGFAETGADGAAWQARLVDAAGDLALLGPNCNGAVNNVTGGSLWPTPGAGPRVERGAALITQSGGLSVHLLMNRRGVAFAYAATVGNQAMIGVEDCIAVLADDPRVTSIALYLEGLREVGAFSRAAALALRRNKPIVALKAGRSEAGAAVSLSHTSSVAGSDELYRTLFDRLGVVAVDSCTELLETVKLFDVSAPPRGRRIVVFTCSGGSSNLGADRADEVGLELPPIPEAARSTLAAQLPYVAAVSNPLDYNTALWGKEAELRGVFGTAMSAGVDAGVLLIDYTPVEYGEPEAERAVARALVHASRATGVPAYVVSILPELLPAEARESLRASGVAPLQGLTDGLKAIALAAGYADARERLLAAPTPLEVPPTGAIDTATVSPPRLLDEWTSKERLAAAGLRVPEGRLCRAEDAASAAAAIGFPVVVKAVGPSIAHKTEIGAVRVGLRDADAVRDAAAAIRRDVEARAGFVPERYLVETMVTDAVLEMIVGVVRHPGFGLALVVGVGGTLVELLRDTRTALLPVGADDVRRMIDSLNASRLLHGYRGRAEADVPALVDAVLAIARFAEANRERLVELDVNPLLVRPRGSGAVAVDALVRLSDLS